MSLTFLGTIMEMGSQIALVAYNLKKRNISHWDTLHPLFGITPKPRCKEHQK